MLSMLGRSAAAAAALPTFTRAAARQPSPTPTAPAAGSLAETYAKHFAVGVSLGGVVPSDYSADELALVKRHFNEITPENSMKMEHVQREEGKFDFLQADELVDYARRHKQTVVGHTLVWARDEATPAWFYKDGNAPVSRELCSSGRRPSMASCSGCSGGTPR